MKRRSTDLEGSFGCLARELQNLHRDLLAFETKTEDKLKERNKRFGKVDSELDYLRRDVGGLRADLSKIVGDAIREANAEKPRRK